MAELTVRGDISSQYISALLMIGPQLPGGLRLCLTGNVGSRPYIRMTLALMQHFGAECRDLGSVIEVRPVPTSRPIMPSNPIGRRRAIGMQWWP